MRNEDRQERITHGGKGESKNFDVTRLEAIQFVVTVAILRDNVGFTFNGGFQRQY